MKSFLLSKIFNALLDWECYKSSEESNGDDDSPSDSINPEEPAAAVHVLEVELPLDGAARLVEVEAFIAGVQGVVSSPRVSSLESRILFDDIPDRLLRGLGRILAIVLIVEGLEVLLVRVLQS